MITSKNHHIVLLTKDRQSCLQPDDIDIYDACSYAAIKQKANLNTCAVFDNYRLHISILFADDEIDIDEKITQLKNDISTYMENTTGTPIYWHKTYYDHVIHTAPRT